MAASARDLVLGAFGFEAPERIPRFDNFWEYPASWAQRLGPAHGLSDIAIWVPEEGAFCTRARHLREEAGWIYEADTWGRTIRRRQGAYFVETLQVPIPPGTDPDQITFDSPALDSRYLKAATEAETLALLAADKAQHCVFGKTGGPYLRTTFVRGEEQFLLDIAGDPPLARALAEKMADHLIGLAQEQLRRWSLHDTGVWIYDDMAYNEGPMFSPRSFEQVFLPAYQRMIRAFKEADARWVLLHSDGDILPILDMLVEAGIDGLNPLEKRAGMDAALIRRHYPRLILTGGMCNTHTLVHGPAAAVEAEARELIDLGQQGGLVIGTHSISPEIPFEFYETYHHTCQTYGNFRQRPAVSQSDEERGR